MNTTRDWESWKLAHAYRRIGSGTTPTSSLAEYYDDSSGTPWITTSELRETYIERTATNVTPLALSEFTALRTYAPNSVFMAMYGATIGRLGISTVPAACNQACCVFEASERFHNRFLFFWLWHRRAELISLSAGGGQPNLSQQDLRSEKAICPPIEVQKRIAAFLDAKTAQIDGLVEKKRALLERLAEKRQAIITQAVTKGLNPAAPMKDSGIDWFGQIPAHWEVKPLKRTIFYQEGPGIMAADFREEGVPLLRVASVGGRWATLNGVNYLEPEMVARKWKHFQTREGDLLISASATSGIVSEVRREAVGCIPYTGIIRLNAIPEQSASSFIRHFAVSQPFIAQIDQLKAGSTIQHFGPYHLGLMSLAVPPVCEQTKIADYLDDILGRCEAVEAQVNGSVTRLTEYRSALITAAVTGQIEGLR